MYWSQFWRVAPGALADATAVPVVPTPAAVVPAAAAPIDEDDALASFYQELAPALHAAPAAVVEPPAPEQVAASLAEVEAARSRAMALADDAVPAGMVTTVEADVVAPRRVPIVIDEESLIDRTKLHCLLCQRAFKSAAVLDKHVQQSDLHKARAQRGAGRAHSLTWRGLVHAGKHGQEAARTGQAGQVGGAPGR
jgi:hypothetical protein